MHKLQVLEKFFRGRVPNHMGIQPETHLCVIDPSLASRKAFVVNLLASRIETFLLLVVYEDKCSFAENPLVVSINHLDVPTFPVVKIVDFPESIDKDNIRLDSLMKLVEFLVLLRVRREAEGLCEQEMYVPRRTQGEMLQP